MKPNATSAIHVATTSHGLGHLTRTLALLRTIHEQAPGCQIHLSTTASSDWLRAQLDFDVVIRRQDYEPGAVQTNCFEVDVPATIGAYVEFHRERERRLEIECNYLTSHSFVGVISDIPALAVRAAHEVGLPAIGVSNFTWDWILEPWCTTDYAWVARRLREDYSRGSRQLCLPLGPDSSPFPESEPAPLIARQATRTAAEVRAALDLGEQRVAVVCPGGWSGDDWPRIFARPGDFQLVTVGDLPIDADVPLRRLGHSLPGGLALTDLIAAADVVLGKAGYGLASECAIHSVPFAMIDRPHFRETPVLMAQYRAIGRSSDCSVDEFFSGKWQAVLERAISEKQSVAIAGDGASRIARRILELFSLDH